MTVEVEVHGGKLIRHNIDGRTVIEYSEPQLDDTRPRRPSASSKPAAKMLTGGTISLQSESHPVEFRKVEIRELKE